MRFGVPFGFCMINCYCCEHNAKTRINYTTLTAKLTDTPSSFKRLKSGHSSPTDGVVLAFLLLLATLEGVGFSASLEAGRLERLVATILEKNTTRYILPSTI